MLKGKKIYESINHFGLGMAYKRKTKKNEINKREIYFSLT